MTPEQILHMKVKRDKRWALITDGMERGSTYQFLKKVVDRAFEDGYLTALSYRHDEATRLEDSHLLGDIADKNSM